MPSPLALWPADRLRIVKAKVNHQYSKSTQKESKEKPDGERLLPSFPRHDPIGELLETVQRQQTLLLLAVGAISSGNNSAAAAFAEKKRGTYA